MVAPIASLLGAPLPTPTTSLQVWGYPAQLGPAVEEYAQLRRYATEAFGADVTICVHCCSQLVHSTLNRPVFDLELEGVLEHWQGVQLGAPDTRLPSRLWDQTTRSSSQWQYQPLGPRARMTCATGSGGVLQQPVAAPKAPDHRGDLAMATAESAVVDVDEEDTNILQCSAASSF